MSRRRRLSPTTDHGAQRIAPLLLAPELEGRSGLLFNNKARAILPSAGSTAPHAKAVLSESQALVARAQAAQPV